MAYLQKIKSRFHGGIHAPEKKAASEKSIETAPIPNKIVLPLIQHTGAPANPIVEKGSTVLTGQKIAEATGHISSPIHASISGKVTDIIPWMHPTIGKPVESVLIESDGKDEPWPVKKTHADYLRCSPTELIEKIKDFGIVGLGGAVFPTHVKLSPPENIKIDTLILNGAECEPYLTADDRLMQENSKEIVEGAKIILHILGARRVIFAIEENKPKAIQAIRKAVSSEPDMEVAALRTRYPQGAEKQLIQVLQNREVPSGGLPLHLGIVVQNVGTAFSIHRAMTQGESLTSRIVTVGGTGIVESKNLRVRIGTLIRDLVETCGGLLPDASQVIMGGPMMGIAQPGLDVPVIKATSGILFFTKKEILSSQNQICIRCGKCVRACPMRLFPNLLSLAIENEQFEEAEKYFVSDCIECGCCSYSCPAGRSIVQQIKWAKTTIKK